MHFPVFYLNLILFHRFVINNIQAFACYISFSNEASSQTTFWRTLYLRCFVRKPDMTFCYPALKKCLWETEMQLIIVGKWNCKPAPEQKSVECDQAHKPVLRYSHDLAARGKSSDENARTTTHNRSCNNSDKWDKILITAT